MSWHVCVVHVQPSTPEPLAPTSLVCCDAADVVKRVTTRGRDACAKMGGAADVGSRSEVEAFLQLCAIWELLVATRKGRHEQVTYGGGGEVARGGVSR